MGANEVHALALVFIQLRLTSTSIQLQVESSYPKWQVEDRHDHESWIPALRTFGASAVTAKIEGPRVGL